MVLPKGAGLPLLADDELPDEDKGNVSPWRRLGNPDAGVRVGKWTKMAKG